MEIFVFVLNKYQSVTVVSKCIFEGLFKTIDFRSVALFTKRYGLFQIFLTQTGLFPPCTLHYKLKKVTKNPLNYYSLKDKKIHGDSVKNKSARTKKTTGWRGRQMPPPSLFKVKGIFIVISNEANVRFTMNGAFYTYI